MSTCEEELAQTRARLEKLLEAAKLYPGLLEYNALSGHVHKRIRNLMARNRVLKAEVLRLQIELNRAKMAGKSRR